MNKTIDFTELQNEVMEFWDERGVNYIYRENTGFNSPDPTNYELFIKDDFLSILNDVDACINELGFDSIASYIAGKKQEENTGGIDSYEDYLSYLSQQGIASSPWVLEWTKEIFKERQKGQNGQ